MPPATRQRSRTALALAALGAAIACVVAMLGNPAAAAGKDRTLTLYVSPDGKGTAWCQPQVPCSLERAQEVVRSADGHDRDIVVQLAGGTYRLTEPLRFDARDSGSADHPITWTAAPGETPVISGASPVTGWTESTAMPGVWEAPAPADANLEARQLYVDGRLATRARTELPRDALTFTADGVDLADSLAWLADIDQPDRTELEFVGSFTHRRSPVADITADRIAMAQPAWNNNTWGWDTVQRTFRAGPLYIVNAREFLDEDGEWYLDREAGKVYYKPLDGQDVTEASVELPRLETLLEIGGTYDEPVHDLRFSGIQFTGTTWTTPSTDEGYASQQTGAYLVGSDHDRPADAFATCAEGCKEFEGARNTFLQMPAAVQVSAAHRIELSDNVYTGIGSVGLGIGNDANAHATGIGLGASDIVVTRSQFHETAGQAIVAGGIALDSHHPSDERMIVEDVTISDNLVDNVAIEYKDGAGILATYVTRANIVRNEVRNLPYSGINTGYGWGAHDPGGSPEYLERGLYNYQPIYDTPTTLVDNHIAFNYLHDVMLEMNDGAAFYNLSAAPGSVLEGNYIRLPDDPPTGRAAVYFDEGSRYWSVKGNVFDAAHTQFFNQRSNNHTGDVAYTDNWVIGGSANFADGRGTNTVTGTVGLARGESVPADAARVIYNAGIAPELRTGTDPSRPELAVDITADGSVAPGSAITVELILTNVAEDVDLTDLSLTATASEGWTVEPVDEVPASLEAGGSAQIELRLTAPESVDEPIEVGTVEVAVGFTVNGDQNSRKVNAATAVGAPVSTLRTYGSVPGVLGELDGAYAIRNAGADIWGAGGQRDDEYGTVYAPDSFQEGSVVTVRVDAVDPVNPWTKAGLVIRNDVTEPEEATGYVVLVATPDNGVSLQWDSDGDGFLDQGRQQPAAAPVWLRLSREGDQVTAEFSANGTDWTQLGAPVTAAGTSATQDAGMIFTAHSTSVGQAQFSEFTVETVEATDGDQAV
ncbi:hypothetical protein O1R50_23095 [Glycomyces luteolus]|uniref:GH141-like insertion domain-containing protein n=2 Tax=Glycomyces TaxID=58113 RepID=A0A9X3PFH8_9ACTN|nr:MULTISPECIES: hypothetical protein [Glycomyces]MDA1362528.1 hypothetical protein [Glycomyces luteolus]MDN3239135.1 hypothetical protein [Glycomyces tritici]